MKRGLLALASLCILTELIGFSIRSAEHPALLLPLHGGIVLLGALLIIRSVPRSRIAPALMILAAVLLSGLDLWRLLQPRESRDPDAIRAAIEKDAATLLGSFKELLARERMVVESLPAAIGEPVTDRAQIFASLEARRAALGRRNGSMTVTVYDAGGGALAWTGRPSVLEERDLQGVAPGTLAQFVRRLPLATKLLTVRTLAPGGRRVVGEMLLDAPYDPQAWRHHAPLLSTMHSEMEVEFLERKQADETLGEFFKEGGDRYWTRGGQEGSELLVPVRDAAGAPLALLTLRPESQASAAARNDRAARVPPILLLLAASTILLVAALTSARRWGLGPSELTALALLAVCLRIGALALVPFLGPMSLFDYRVFSLPVPFRLMASPGDALLTGLTVFVLAWLVIGVAREGGRAARSVAFAIGLLLAAGLVLLTPAWVSDSTLNLARSPFTEPIAPRLCLGWSHAAIALAAVLLVARALLRGGRSISFRGLAALCVAASAGSYLLFAREAAKVPPALIETNLAPDVIRAGDERRDWLLHTMERASDGPRWEALESGDQTAIDRLAFDEWRSSDLGRAGLRSALAILNDQGVVLASFAYGLPDSVFHDVERAAAPPLSPAGIEPRVTDDALTYLSLEIPLLRGDVPLIRDGRSIGRLTALVSTERDNLPFLTLNDPLLRTLGAGHSDVGEEYFGGAPLFLAYSHTGEVLFPSAEKAAPLPARELPVREARWTTTHFAGVQYRIYLFPTSDGPRALGYAATPALAVSAGLVRAAAGNLPLLFLLIGAVAFRRLSELRGALSASALGGFLAGSYYRRVVTVVLVSSLLPLLLLAVTFRNVLETRAREEFEREGVEAAGTLRRLLEDFVASREDEDSRIPIRSKTLFWLGRTVHQDIHLFVEDRLVATSRGDPEASGLRSFRLSAEVVREIARNRPPHILSEERRAGRREALVYAPVRLGEGWPDTVLAVPLLVQDRDLARAAEPVSDALLTATFGLGIVLSGVGYLFARRLSIPIRELGEAARRIGGGSLDVRVRPRGRDEIRDLVDAFNGMVVALGEQREDLRRRKDYIEAILLNVTTGVISTGSDGIVRTNNPAASLLLDLPVDLTGRSLLDELDRRKELAPLREIWARDLGRPPAGAPHEIALVRRGEEVRLRSVVLPLSESSDQPAGRIFLVEDVTDVMRSNRLAAWAEMARRIAHEIKNPLTPIQLSAEHLLRVRRDGRSDFDQVLRECVETILGQVRALREISSDFSTYARLPDLQKEPSDLAGLLRSTLAPYHAARADGVRIVEEIEPTPPLSLDVRVLRGALVNLIENALQAMEGGGVLRVSLSLRASGEARFAEIVVADTGAGMSEETRARIFEPYFSTRDAGVGLGLPIALRAVEEHGGTLTAESSPGHGTRMIIRLPLRSETPGGPRTDRADLAPGSGAVAPPAGKEHSAESGVHDRGDPRT